MATPDDDEAPQEVWPPAVDFPNILDDNSVLSVAIVHFCRDERFGDNLWDIGSSALVKLGEARLPGWRYTPDLASLRAINRLWFSSFARLTCHHCGAAAYLGLFRRFFVNKCHAHFCPQCKNVQGRVTTQHILCRPCWDRHGGDN